ncbi:MAG: ExbD/TolR family protein [Chthoniobacterales bacterium]
MKRTQQRRRRRKSRLAFSDFGFQIAPMIDVVFVIMLFFMVMAGAVKVERELNSTLPGTAETTGPTNFVDEVIITISDAGEVALNDEPMDSAASRDLPQLRDTLLRAKASSDAAKSQMLVTILSEPESRYTRAIDVLDALAVAHIENVSFTISDEE